MAVHWNLDSDGNASGDPEVVVGLSNGCVMFYNHYNGKWNDLPGDGFGGSSIAAMSVFWNQDSYGEITMDPNVVVALANGNVKYYDPNRGWNDLSGDNVLNGQVIRCMSVHWNLSSKGNVSGDPDVVIGLQQGQVYYYNASEWSSLNSDFGTTKDASLQQNTVNVQITTMAVKWKINLEGSVSGNPFIVIGLTGEGSHADGAKTGEVWLYDGSVWMDMELDDNDGITELAVMPQVGGGYPRILAIN